MDKYDAILHFEANSGRKLADLCREKDAEIARLNQIIDLAELKVANIKAEFEAMTKELKK